MDYDFTPFFNTYEALVKEVDGLFQRIQEAHPDCVTCKPGCSECCHALFDLSLIEAMYLNHKFNERYQGIARSTILERADRADREAYRLKRKMFKASQEGLTTREILDQAASMRVRCPLLNDEDCCDLYDHRPITCRLYGVPTAIAGQGHTCGHSAFDPGQSYPTVQMDKIHDKLMDLSKELIESLPTKSTNLVDVLVPASMALANDYDADYLGIVECDDGCGTGGSWIIDGDNSRFEAMDCNTCDKQDSCDPDACMENRSEDGR